MSSDLKQYSRIGSRGRYEIWIMQSGIDLIVAVGFHPSYMSSVIPNGVAMPFVEFQPHLDAAVTRLIECQRPRTKDDEIADLKKEKQELTDTLKLTQDLLRGRENNQPRIADLERQLRLTISENERLRKRCNELIRKQKDREEKPCAGCEYLKRRRFTSAAVPSAPRDNAVVHSELVYHGDRSING